MEPRFNYRAANMPAFKAMLAFENFTSSSSVDKVLYELIKIRVSQINGCAFCLNMHCKDLLNMGDYQDQVMLISVWREASIFTEEERAALELTEYVTKISDAGVPQEVYERVRDHFDEKEYIDLIMSINAINSWNRLAISSGLFAGYQE